MAVATQGKDVLTMAEFTQKSVDAALDFLVELKSKAKAAHEANDVFMMGVYADLIKVTSPIVNRAHARLLREDRAKINAAHKELRARTRDEGAKNRDELPHLTRE